MHFNFPPKISLCMIYKRFKIMGHWKCPHKSPSPCNTYVIPMSLYKFAVENHWNGASFLHSLIGNEKRRGTIYSVFFWIQRWKSNGSHARICTAVTHIADRWCARVDRWSSGGWRLRELSWHVQMAQQLCLHSVSFRRNFKFICRS